MDLFENKKMANGKSRQLPLAAKMRPLNFGEFAGQGHILAEGKLLRRAILFFHNITPIVAFARIRI